MNATARQAGFHRTDPSAGFEINLTSVERILRRTPLIGVGEYRCPVDHPQFAGGGPQKCPYIAFSRSSVRLIPNRGPPEVCTPNTVNLYDVGDGYTRRAVSKEGAICDWIAVAPELLREIADYVNPAANGSSHVFSRAVAPIAPRTFLAQRTFFCSLQQNATISQLEIEEYAIRLVERVVEETARFSRKLASSRTQSNRAVAARRREMIEETKCVLAREYWNQFPVAELARRVHCSPGYLSRSFSRVSGFTLHGYQQQLRLRAALQLLCESRFNGSGIALQLGFANHSHFSDVFKTKFGVTPTQFSRSCSAASLEAMHSLLDADERKKSSE
ncbi:MAG TPA: AraC family transcriptional regulator [Rudaea sp.]|nr:AraC family transcriptional regulator [Rudaea sp.]